MAGRGVSASVQDIGPARVTESRKAERAGYTNTIQELQTSIRALENGNKEHVF